MNRWLLITILLLSICLLSALTLDEAKELALKNNSKYLGQKKAFESARWAKQQALSNMLPSLTASGTYAYLDPATKVQTGMSSITLNHDSRSASLTLSQPLFMGGKLWQAYKISDISSEIAKLSMQNTRLSILSKTENKYYNILQLKDLLKIATADLESSRQSLAVAQIRYDNGTISLADLLKIKAKKASKEVALIQSQTALKLAEHDFVLFLGLNQALSVEPQVDDYDMTNLRKLAELEETKIAKFEQDVYQIAKESNLSLKTAKSAVTLSKKAYNIARGSFLPTVVLSASRSFRENGIDRYEFTGGNTIALTASLPILPFWNNYSASRKAYYDLQKSTLDFQTAEDGIMLSVRAAGLNLFSSARQVVAAETALQMTRESFEQLSERYRNNMLSVSDMLDAEVMLMAAETSYTNAFYAYLKAFTALSLSTGIENFNIYNYLN